jgi:1-acyl-sn-glycerol-3-phosphate acyltransferase
MGECYDRSAPRAPQHVAHPLGSHRGGPLANPGDAVGAGRRAGHPPFRRSGISRPSMEPPSTERDLLPQIIRIGRAVVRLGYFSIEVQGLEHVPRAGRVVFAANHAGWFPIDAFVLGFVVGEAHGLARVPYFATADAALGAPVLGRFMQRVGALPASWFRRPARLPPSVESIGIFPEGVRGNCKPFWEAYRMRGWARGFVRAAMARRASVVPVAILGGEECVPVGWTVRLLEPVLGTILPLPLTPLPLPARWKVVFHAPLPAPPQATSPQEQGEIARAVQGTVQATLDREAAHYPLGRLATYRARTRPGPVDDDPLDR